MSNKINSLYDVLITPTNTEKSTLLNGQAKYTFYVNTAANKQLVKKAVEVFFGKKVKSINIVNLPKKAKIFRGRKGWRSGQKKAIVTLVGNDTQLDFLSIV